MEYLLKWDDGRLKCLLENKNLKGMKPWQCVKFVRDKDASFKMRKVLEVGVKGIRSGMASPKRGYAEKHSR